MFEGQFMGFPCEYVKKNARISQWCKHVKTRNAYYLNDLFVWSCASYEKWPQRCTIMPNDFHLFCRLYHLQFRPLTEMSKKQNTNISLSAKDHIIYHYVFFWHCVLTLPFAQAVFVMVLYEIGSELSTEMCILAEIIAWKLL